jgi:peptidoglycan/LPS O-acetylase OafA/YrhL
LIYLALHCEPGPIGGRIFQFAGGLSYAVYAVHASLFHAIEGISAHHHYNLAATAPISGLVFLAGLLLICVLLNKFYDVPLRRTLTRRFLK